VSRPTARSPAGVMGGLSATLVAGGGAADDQHAPGEVALAPALPEGFARRGPISHQRANRPSPTTAVRKMPGCLARAGDVVCPARLGYAVPRPRPPPAEVPSCPRLTSDARSVGAGRSVRLDLPSALPFIHASTRIPADCRPGHGRGYDSGGFLNTVTDPNGVVTTTGHDVRGNVVSRTTCQNQATNTCSTTYYTYFPDGSSPNPPANPSNDVVLTMRDGRSASSTDDTYRTTHAYDTHGNRTSVTTPAVSGYPSGRTTTTTYTDGTTVPAFDTATSPPAPPGLPYTATPPGGAVTTTQCGRPRRCRRAQSR
jgi:hypothetical protein